MTLGKFIIALPLFVGWYNQRRHNVESKRKIMFHVALKRIKKLCKNQS